MKTILEKLLIKIIMPVFIALIEEAIKLIMEAITNDDLEKKDKIKYVINGITGKIENIDSIN